MTTDSCLKALVPGFFDAIANIHKATAASLRHAAAAIQLALVNLVRGERTNAYLHSVYFIKL